MKKLLSIIFTFALVASTLSFGALTVSAVMGDVNGDGYIDNLDAAAILKYDAGITPEITEAADVNGDGYTDNLDAAKILKYDAGIIDSLEPQPDVSGGKTNYALGKTYTLTRNATETDPAYLYLGYSNGTTDWADLELKKMTDGIVGDITDIDYAGATAGKSGISVCHQGTNAIFEYIVDLGEVYSDIDNITFRNVRDGRDYGANRGFRLRLAYVSEDGITYTKVAGTETNLDIPGAPEIKSTLDETVFGVQHFDVQYKFDTPQKGRYVKFIVVSDGGYVIQFEEIEIWN